MAMVIKPKRKFTAGAPSTSDLVEGEIAVNTADKKLYVRDDSNNIVEIGGGGGGSGRRDRRRRRVEVCPLPEPFSSSCGMRIDQRSGRSRLGASRTPSSCLACWRNLGSRQRLSSLQVAMAFSSCPWPIQAVIIRSRRPGPSGLLSGCCSARGRSSSRPWP